MLKSCDRNRVSPTEQMYAVNRIAGLGQIMSAGPFRSKGLAGLGESTDIVSQVVGFISKLAGLFTKDPYRDIHIQAQNATVDGYRDTINALQTKNVQGTITRDDVNRAIYNIQALKQTFVELTNDLARKYPQDASRYMAGQKEVSALGDQIVRDMKSQYGSILSASSGTLSDIARSVTGLFTGGGGGNSLTPLLLTAAAFFVLPRLMKR